MLQTMIKNVMGLKCFIVLQKKADVEYSMAHKDPQSDNPMNI